MGNTVDSCKKYIINNIEYNKTTELKQHLILAIQTELIERDYSNLKQNQNSQNNPVYYHPIYCQPVYYQNENELNKNNSVSSNNFTKRKLSLTESSPIDIPISRFAKNSLSPINLLNYNNY